MDVINTSMILLSTSQRALNIRALAEAGRSYLDFILAHNENQTLTVKMTENQSVHLILLLFFLSR